MTYTQSAQDLIDEVSGISRPKVADTAALINRLKEAKMEQELQIAIQQELSGDLSPECAQALIDEVE